MLIGEIEKNALQKIRVSSERYKGHDFVDIRIFYQDEVGADYKPTKKGIAIAPDKLEGLIALLRKAQKPSK
jgi:2,3-bisphosphoglycerate-independent phosphoglycerate mutase